MSVHVLSWVLQHSEARNADRLVLIAIADHASHDGTNSWPSVDRLKQYARLSERQVRSSITALRDAGRISVEYNAGPHGANVYTVLMTPAESAPLQDLQGAGSAATPAGSAPLPLQNLPGTPAGSAPKPSLTVNRTVREPSSAEVLSLKPVSPEAEKLCTHLADRIEGNTGKRPKIPSSWYDAARRMIEIDHIPIDHIHRAIDWAHDSDFWCSNILSMPKLREKYQTMLLQAQRVRNQQSTTDARVNAWLTLPTTDGSGSQLRMEITE